MVWIHIHVYGIQDASMKKQTSKCTMTKFCSTLLANTGLDIKHLFYMPIGHVVLKIYVPCKNFHMPRQNLYKPCEAYVYCWENKYMPRLKNQLHSRARNRKSLCALGQDLHAPGKRACLNVEPWNISLNSLKPKQFKELGQHQIR